MARYQTTLELEELRLEARAEQPNLLPEAIRASQQRLEFVGNFVFSSPNGNREHHMLDHCKAVATRAGLDPAKFDLKTFR